MPTSKVRLKAILDTGHTFAPGRLMNKKHGQLGIQKIPALAFLLWHDDYGYILFDTGYSRQFFEASRAFPQHFYRWGTPVSTKPEQAVLKQLNQHDISLADVKMVILSHLHADHVGGLGPLMDQELVGHLSEYEFVQSLAGFNQVRHGYLKDLIEPLDGRFQEIDDRSGQVPFEEGGLTVVDLPGHSQGMFGLAFVDQRTGKPTLLGADASWTQEAIDDPADGPIRAAGIIMHSWDDYLASMEKLRQYRKDGYDIILSHEKRSSQWFN
ncbi:MBL fold metallo-hydrolase [Leuconostocaceae bacterium ESL0723]|nr:MBL fold metallo-hydrolase [Leuconostocaceae bacterium ESL0723]